MQIIFVLAYAIFIYDLRLNNENLSFMTNKIKNFGGCACGKIRYKTLGYPTVSAVCHCRYCQLRSGSAFGVLVYFLEDNFEIIKGNTKRYSFISETGNKWVNNFVELAVRL